MALKLHLHLKRAAILSKAAFWVLYISRRTPYSASQPSLQMAIGTDQRTFSNGVRMVLLRQFSSYWWTALALVFSVWEGSCDPIRIISVSQVLQQSPEHSCILRVLRASEYVSAAGVANDGTLYADLILSTGIDPPNPRGKTQVLLQETLSEEGKDELEFRVVLFGALGTVEYRQFVEMVLRKLEAATLDECSR